MRNKSHPKFAIIDAHNFCADGFKPVRARNEFRAALKLGARWARRGDPSCQCWITASKHVAGGWQIVKRDRKGHALEATRIVIAPA